MALESVLFLEFWNFQMVSTPYIVTHRAVAAGEFAAPNCEISPSVGELECSVPSSVSVDRRRVVALVVIPLPAVRSYSRCPSRCYRRIFWMLAPFASAPPNLAPASHSRPPFPQVSEST